MYILYTTAYSVPPVSTCTFSMPSPYTSNSDLTEYGYSSVLEFCFFVLTKVSSLYNVLKLVLACTIAECVTYPEVNNFFTTDTEGWTGESRWSRLGPVFQCLRQTNGVQLYSKCYIAWNVWGFWILPALVLPPSGNCIPLPLCPGAALCAWHKPFMPCYQI